MLMSYRPVVKRLPSKRQAQRFESCQPKIQNTNIRNSRMDIYVYIAIVRFQIVCQAKHNTAW